MDMFPDAELVRDIQKQLDTTVIQAGVANITKLIQVTQEIKTGLPAGSRKEAKEPSGKSGQKVLKIGYIFQVKFLKMGIFSAIMTLKSGQGFRGLSCTPFFQTENVYLCPPVISKPNYFNVSALRTVHEHRICSISLTDFGLWPV